MQDRAQYEPNAAKPHSPCVKIVLDFILFYFIFSCDTQWVSGMYHKKKIGMEHFEMFHFSKCLMSFYDLQGTRRSLWAGHDHKLMRFYFHFLCDKKKIEKRASVLKNEMLAVAIISVFEMPAFVNNKIHSRRWPPNILDILDIREIHKVRKTQHQNPEFSPNQVRFLENLQKSTFAFKGGGKGVKLRKEPFLVVNWVSSCFDPLIWGKILGWTCNYPLCVCVWESAEN